MCKKEARTGLRQKGKGVCWPGARRDGTMASASGAPNAGEWKSYTYVFVHTRIILRAKERDKSSDELPQQLAKCREFARPGCGEREISRERNESNGEGEREMEKSVGGRWGTFNVLAWCKTETSVVIATINSTNRLDSLMNFPIELRTHSNYLWQQTIFLIPVQTVTKTSSSLRERRVLEFSRRKVLNNFPLRSMLHDEILSIQYNSHAMRMTR